MAQYLNALITSKYVDRNGDEQIRWTKIGVAFPHRSGKGFSVKLDALPPNGELILLEPKPKQA